MSNASVRTVASTSAPAPDDIGPVCRPEPSRFGIFTECPQCGGNMAPEHAHYRCGSCGWRDSCCD